MKHSFEDLYNEIGMTIATFEIGWLEGDIYCVFQPKNHKLYRYVSDGNSYTQTSIYSTCPDFRKDVL